MNANRIDSLAPRASPALSEIAIPPATPASAMRMNPTRSNVRPRWRGVSRYLGTLAGIGVVVTSVTWSSLGCLSPFRFEGRVGSRSAGKAEEGGAPGLCDDRR
jgi:hypothetical protein